MGITDSVAGRSFSSLAHYQVFCAAQAAGARTGRQATAPPQRILVVDDEPNVRHTIAQMLRLSGYDVVEAATGTEAVALARSAAFDLLLSDIRMPGMDGHATMRAVREAQQGVRGLAMTGYADASSMDAARAAGFHSLMRKPFTLHALLAGVEAALSR